MDNEGAEMYFKSNLGYKLFYSLTYNNQQSVLNNNISKLDNYYEIKLQIYGMINYYKSIKSDTPKMQVRSSENDKIALITRINDLVHDTLELQEQRRHEFEKSGGYIIDFWSPDKVNETEGRLNAT